jgi:hypothetical protein
MQIGAATVSRPLFETGEGHEVLVDLPYLPFSSSEEYTASFVDALGSVGEQQVRVAPRRRELVASEPHPVPDDERQTDTEHVQLPADL